MEYLKAGYGFKTPRALITRPMTLTCHWSIWLYHQGHIVSITFWIYIFNCVIFRRAIYIKKLTYIRVRLLFYEEVLVKTHRISEFMNVESSLLISFFAIPFYLHFDGSECSLGHAKYPCSDLQIRGLEMAPYHRCSSPHCCLATK